VGNLISAVDPDSALTFDYDGANRLTQSETTGSPNQPDVTVDYTYDKNDNRLTMTDSVNGTTTYTYDNLNRLDSITDPSPQTVDFDYDVLSRRTLTTLPNGTTTDFAYDAASQLLTINHKLLTTFSSFGYLYDNVGNRTTQNTVRSAISVEPSLTYTYDNLYRLTQATNPLPAMPDETFDYDALGNRDPLTSTYDNANRLTDDGTNTYTYDDNGNLTQKVEPSLTTDYIYDAENQLIEIQENTITIGQYRYDGLGRRIEKDAGGTVTRYVYDNEDIVLEYDGSNVLQASYTHGLGTDEPLIMNRGGVNSFYHADGLGSIVDLTDNLGTVVQSYVYDSFGNIVLQNGSLTNPYTYTGREFDEESGLYYYRARYYDPKLGRFLQEDPIGFAGGELNFYSYVSNNPVNFIDPSGRFSLPPEFFPLPGVDDIDEVIRNIPKKKDKTCPPKRKRRRLKLPPTRIKPPLKRPLIDDRDFPFPIRRNFGPKGITGSLFFPVF